MSAPRVIVTRHRPWPLRWAVIALVFGFSAAIGLWAFEFGKDIAGLDRDAKEELNRLRVEVQQLRIDRDKAHSFANSAESLLKAERSAQDRLARQLKELETDHLALKGDLGFFERMFPPTGLSRFRASSDIFRIGQLEAGQSLRLGMAAWDCLSLAKAVHAETNGAFDITIGPLMELFVTRTGERRHVNASVLEEARQIIGSHRFDLDEAEMTVTVHASRMIFDLGALGKGYALDQTADVLAMHGVHNAVLNAGHKHRARHRQARGQGRLESHAQPRHQADSTARPRRERQRLCVIRQISAKPPLAPSGNAAKMPCRFR